jgi:hypothetical protein
MNMKQSAVAVALGLAAAMATASASAQPLTAFAKLNDVSRTPPSAALQEKAANAVGAMADKARSEAGTRETRSKARERAWLALGMMLDGQGLLHSPRLEQARLDAAKKATALSESARAKGEWSESLAGASLRRAAAYFADPESAHFDPQSALPMLNEAKKATELGADPDDRTAQTDPRVWAFVGASVERCAKGAASCAQTDKATLADFAASESVDATPQQAKGASERLFERAKAWRLDPDGAGADVAPALEKTRRAPLPPELRNDPRYIIGS